jgi:putative nucleotidyltransferase with HDIG domain
VELPSTQKVKMERTQEELRLLIRNEIEQGDNLPSFSSAGQKALSLIKVENIGIPELSKTILHDPGMTAAILRVVNSTFYGLQRNITKVPEAISYIGLSETKHIIYVAFARSLFGVGLSGKSWRHSVATAFIAEGIAKFSSLDIEEAYICGLLHDIGKTFLQSRIAPRYYSIMAALENVEKAEVVDSERRVFGYDHAAIGEMLLRRWNFADRFAQAVGMHHTPDQPDQALSQVVALANQIAHQVEEPTPTKSTLVNPDTLTYIRSNPSIENSTYYFAQEQINSFLEKVSVLI